MSETFLPDFLGGEPVSEAAPAAEAPAAAQPAADAAPAAEAAPAAQPEAAPAEGQPRDAGGKFTSAIAPAATPPAEAAPAAQAEPAAAAPAAEPHHVPVTALLDEREKRQKLEADLATANAEAARLRQWREQEEAKARARPIPSREEDPAAWEQHREALIQNELRSIRLTNSRQIAEVKHGEDVVAKAYDWGFGRCETDPFFNAKVAASPDPVSFVVAEWKREQAAEKFGSVDPKEFESFQQWKAAQAAAPAQGEQPPAQPAAAPPAAPVAPRPSLAAGPSAGRADVAQPGDGEAVFDGMFRK